MSDKCLFCGADYPGNVGSIKMCMGCYQNPLGPKLVEQAERIRELEAKVARLKEQLERPRICISCQRRAVMTTGKSA